ncbi:MAG TPA: phosphate signaling complex protein PhoU [Gaiellales bacterium]|jgi:phosphate transport system protein|nr:phosphate signaling complex protein PhoU [Gaiellales bacterium]
MALNEATPMRADFHDELERLQQLVDDEGKLVAQALRSATRALVLQDSELAEEVIAFDDVVDLRYLGIEEGVQSLLARQTPVAVDLRLVLAIVHVNLHLERMADLCVTVAKLTRLTDGLAVDAQVVRALGEMGARADEMIAVAMSSFQERDVAAAESLVELDDLIDAANRRLVRRLLERGADPGAREWGMRMIVVSRCLERVGDHAVDIGERTAYLVTGEFREFGDASHPPA